MISHSQTTGFQAEQMAYRYLKQQGLTLMDRNFRYTQGEIDLIMSEASAIIFIEVRYRSSHAFGYPLDTISIPKQQRIINTAQYYLKKHNLLDKTDCRFDVVAINKDQSIHWIKNAFDVHH